ncbi:hypothetical protein LQZ21_06595 [Treponema sp. TIM-1]|uniref:hypothetical protein n=1 Tax=Treponema sp. TIM-1 TaxID=2898417 RepID=UPI0039814E11
MRYFLCPVEQFFLGVPEDAVAAIMIYSEGVTKTVSRYEGGDTFFSLPHFFGLADRTVRHGIILKSSKPGASQNNGAASEPEEGARNILLVSSVEREADVPPEEIYSLPELLLASGHLSFFTGIAFERSLMIALIDPAALIAQIFRMQGEPV